MAALTAERARALLDYDPGTGVLTWKAHPKVKHHINTRLLGAEAGAVGTLGYRLISVDKERLNAHRVIWLMVHGHWPEGEIDHINGDRADNRLVNLRDVPRAENRKNMCMRSDNTSGVVGVYWYKNRWVADIRVNGKTIYLGRYQNIEDATRARKQAEARHGFHKNHGREAA